MRNNLLLLFFLLLPAQSFALFCPNNFNQIDIGDSIEKVRATCGKPDSESTNDAEVTGPEEWDYFKHESVNLYSTIQQQGSLKVSLAFDAGGKIINLSVNGIGVGATGICGTTLSLGDSREQAKAACGEPALTMKSNQANAAANKPDKITEFIYKTTPPITLMFINGKLGERE